MKRFWNWLTSFWRPRLPTPAPYSRGPLPPEVIEKPKGACGVPGCANRRKHSHVDALVRRFK